MKQTTHKPGDMHWLVKRFNMNKQCIEDYDVLRYREEQIKKFKKQYDTKEEFAEKLRREFQWMYWSRAEWELIIEFTEDGRVLLRPWVGCRDDEYNVDVTNDTSFDWKGFAKKHINSQIYNNKAKVDIFDMLTYEKQFERLVDYCWYTRWKYERKHPKFEKQFKD